MEKITDSEVKVEERKMKIFSTFLFLSGTEYKNLYFFYS